MSTFYSSELYKLVIDFSDITGLSNYEVSTVRNPLSIGTFDIDHPDAEWTPTSNAGKYIQQLVANFSDGNRGDNPLGNMMSSRISIAVFDDSDTINPMNTSSAYYGHMVPGRKITVYKSQDGTTWNQYFAGFITNWQGSFKDGYYNITSINAEDALNSIGMQDVSDLNYVGINAEQALVAIFTAFGLSSSDYVIDTALDLDEIPYSALKSPARNTINDICYKALAYIAVRQDGKVYVEPLIQTYSGVPDHEIDASAIGPLTPVNTNAVSFSKVKVSYTASSGLSYSLVAQQSEVELEDGVTAIALDTLGKIFSVENVVVTINEGESPQTINDITYSAGDTRVTVEVDADLDDNKTAKIEVYGLIEGGTQTQSVIITLPNSSLGVQSETFEYNASSIMTEQEATDLADKIADYIQELRKQIKIDKTLLSSDVQIGQTIAISDVSATYDGAYRVSAINHEYGDTYNVGVTLLKIN